MEKELIEANVAMLGDDGECVVAAPVTLRPTPFSRKAFQHAHDVQPLFNELVLRTVQERTLLDSVCKRLAEQDDFVRRLYDIFLKYPTAKVTFEMDARAVKFTVFFAVIFQH